MFQAICLYDNQASRYVKLRDGGFIPPLKIKATSLASASKES